MVSETTSAVQDMVTDQFGRIRELTRSVTDGLSVSAAAWRPDPAANSVAWLVWHLARVQDDHVATLAGRQQIWISDGWHERLGLPFAPEDFGFGHSPDDVAAVRVDPAELDAYQQAVHEMCRGYARSVTAEDLAQVIDSNWDPPVTASIRLVSLIGDCLQHLGQAAYVRGMAGRVRTAGGRT